MKRLDEFSFVETGHLSKMDSDMKAVVEALRDIDYKGNNQTRSWT